VLNSRVILCEVNILVSLYVYCQVPVNTFKIVTFGGLRPFSGVLRVILVKCGGTAVAQWLRCCATNRKVAGSIPAGVGGFFIDIKSFRSHYGPGVDSASNTNEY